MRENSIVSTPQCRKTRISLSPKNIFREINYLVTLSLVKPLLSRNFYQVWKFAKFFPHDILQKFRQINFFTKEFCCKSI